MGQTGLHSRLARRGQLVSLGSGSRLLEMGFGQHNVRSAAGISAIDGLLEVRDRRVGIICVQRELSRVKMIFGCIGSRCRTRSEEHTSELQSLMRTSYAVFCLKKK